MPAAKGSICTFSFGALVVGEHHEWRPIAKSVNDGKSAASAGHARFEFCAGEAGSFPRPSLSPLLLVVGVGFGRER